MNKHERISRLLEQVEEIKAVLESDEKEGYLMRPYVRNRLDIELDHLLSEIRETRLNYFNEN